MEKKFQLRSPKAEDMFLMFRIISKIGVRNIKNCFSAEVLKDLLNSTSDKDSEERAKSVGMFVAFEIAGVLMEHLDSAKEDIYAFLARISGMKAAEIAEMEAADFAEIVIETIQLEGFRDFFQRVLGLFK
jgi:hypothetical protein